MDEQCAYYKISAQEERERGEAYAYRSGLQRALELIGENRPEIDEDGMGGAALNYEALGYNQALAELRTRIQEEINKEEK